MRVLEKLRVHDIISDHLIKEVEMDRSPSKEVWQQVGMQNNQLDFKKPKKGGDKNRRWRDELRTYRVIAGQQAAQDRVKWRNGEEAFLVKWSEIG